MHDGGEPQESSRTAPKQLHHLRNLVQQGDAEAFAHELNLDPSRTREWFDHGFTREGCGTQVIHALGSLVLTRILTTSRDRNEHAHG